MSFESKFQEHDCDLSETSVLLLYLLLSFNIVFGARNELLILFTKN